MKKYFAPIALCTWLLVSGQDALAQQRPGEVKSKTGTSQTPRQKSAPKKTVKVKPASHESVVMDGEVIQGEVIHEGHVPTEGCESCGSTVPSSGCDTCGPVGQAGCGTCEIGGYGDLCYQNRGRFYISLPAHGWVHAEGLTWYQSGMNLPPLVTTSPTGTARASAGVIGQQGTSILYGGDEDHLTDPAGGFRIRFGTWLGSCSGLGIEGEYLGLSATESFFAQSTGATGSQILARPFVNMRPGNNAGSNDAELVAFPNVIRGSVGVDLENRLVGAAFRFRRQMCCSSGCGYSDWRCQPVPVSTRIDFTLGYRYWQLNEGLRIREQLTTLATNSTINGGTGSFDIIDQFRTRNQFNGAEMGAVWQGRRGWWSLDMLMRVGFGNMLQTVMIDGSTAITENNVTTNHDSGFLTQRTNIGIYQRERFTMIPELGATLGYQLTRRLRGTVGYTLVYMGNVVRPGDQVDLDVNTNLLPPEANPFTGPLRPQFQFRQTDYWVHGLSYGLEFRW